jgi:OOP family OmpA-OmpF porin
MRSLVLCIGCALATSAQAAEDGWYAVVFGGQSSAQNISQGAIDDSAVAALGAAGLTVVDATSSLDDSDTAFGATLGYEVNEHFATELSYVDLGDVTYDLSGTVTDGVGTFPAELGLESSAQGLAFSLLGILPIGERFSVYGRVGIALMDCEGTSDATINGIADSVSDETQRSNGLFGAGGEYDFGDRFSVRVEWTRHADVGSQDIIGELDIDTYTLALRYNIR